ncbi:MAG: LysR family transcriptional regulator, partial [Myxococcota bacterium]
TVDWRTRRSRATVSKWIASLEDTLSVQLVQRSTRRLRITAAGEILLEDARAILASYEATVDRLGDGALTGSLRVSVPVVFARLFIVPATAEFMALHRKVDIELVFSDRYVNLIEENVDIAIRVGTPVDSTYRSHRLGETQRRLVASPAYLEEAPPLRVAQDLREHQCLCHTGLQSGDVWRLRADGEEVIINVRGRFAANNSEALLTLAKAGHGVALLASWLVDEELSKGTLRELLPTYDLPRAPIRALTTPSPFLSPRVTSFIEHLQHSVPARINGTRSPANPDDG